MSTDPLKINKKAFVQAKVHVDITPGEALAILRKLQGFSQRDLADASGISQPNISALENGRINIGRETALGYALKVHPGVLLFPNSGWQSSGKW